MLCLPTLQVYADGCLGVPENETLVADLRQDVFSQSSHVHHCIAVDTALQHRTGNFQGRPSLTFLDAALFTKLIPSRRPSSRACCSSHCAIVINSRSLYLEMDTFSDSTVLSRSLRPIPDIEGGVHHIGLQIPLRQPGYSLPPIRNTAATLRAVIRTLAAAFASASSNVQMVYSTLKTASRPC